MLSRINMKVPKTACVFLSKNHNITLSLKNYTVSFPGAIYLQMSVCIVIILVDRLFRIQTTGGLSIL